MRVHPNTIQPNNRRNAREDSNGKDPDEDNLLTRCALDAEECFDRQRNDPEVSGDVEGRGGVEERGGVDAVAGDGAGEVPELVGGHALCEGNDDEDEVAAEDEPDCAAAELVQDGLAAELEVEEEDGGFNGRDGEVVADLDCESDLWLVVSDCSGWGAGGGGTDLHEHDHVIW